ACNLGVRRTPDRRNVAEVHDPVGVVRAVDAEIEAEGIAPHELRRQQPLPAPVADAPEILETAHGAGADRRREHALNERVARVLVVERQLTVDAPRSRGEVDAGLEL